MCKNITKENIMDVWNRYKKLEVYGNIKDNDTLYIEYKYSSREYRPYYCEFNRLVNRSNIIHNANYCLMINRYSYTGIATQDAVVFLCDDCFQLLCKYVFSGYCEFCSGFFQNEDGEKQHEMDNDHLMNLYRIGGKEMSEEQEDYFINNTFFCRSCNTRHWDTENARNTYTFLHEDMCNICFNSRFICCSRCGTPFERTEETEEAEENERNTLCDTCRRKPESMNIKMSEPDLQFHGNDRFPYFGIELETDEWENGRDLSFLNWMNTENNLNIWAKHDGSLNYGVEFCFHPRTLHSWYDYYPSFKVFTKLIVNTGALSFKTDTCGLHIHRSNKDLSIFDKTKLIIFFMSCQRQIEKVAQRRNNTYANFTTYSDWIYYNNSNRKTEEPYVKNKLVYTLFKKDSKRCHPDDSRYVAVNFCNPYTIEFRIFRGTLKPETVFASIEFCDAVVNFCKMKNICFCIKHTGDFLWYSFRKFVKHNKYPFLRKYLKHKFGKENICPDNKYIEIVKDIPLFASSETSQTNASTPPHSWEPTYYSHESVEERIIRWRDELGLSNYNGDASHRYGCVCSNECRNFTRYIDVCVEHGVPAFFADEYVPSGRGAPEGLSRLQLH